MAVLICWKSLGLLTKWLVSLDKLSIHGIVKSWTGYSFSQEITSRALVKVIRHSERFVLKPSRSPLWSARRLHLSVWFQSPVSRICFGSNLFKSITCWNVHGLLENFILGNKLSNDEFLLYFNHIRPILIFYQVMKFLRILVENITIRKMVDLQGALHLVSKLPSSKVLNLFLPTKISYGPNSINIFQYRSKNLFMRYIYIYPLGAPLISILTYSLTLKRQQNLVQKPTYYADRWS